MIVLLSEHSAEAEVNDVVSALESAGVSSAVGRRDGRPMVICDKEVSLPVSERIRHMRGVADIHQVSGPHRLADRSFADGATEVDVDGVTFGGNDFVVIAGPCAVESSDQLADVAGAVASSGAAALRGGAYKPRSSPYSFQGLGQRGLELLGEQRARTGLPVVTELVEAKQVEQVSQYADVLQVGARNMQNFGLLRDAGQSGLPVLLKRGLCATVGEWLQAAEYVLCEGAEVILCERGIRTYEPSTRFTLDVSAVPVVKRLSHLPVIVDPSHAAGRSYLVQPLAMAAAAAGADGLLVDVHTDAETARCDGPQALNAEEFEDMMTSVDRVVESLGRRRARPKLRAATERARRRERDPAGAAAAGRR